MKTTLITTAVAIGLSGAATAQTIGDCRDGYRWNGGDGVARYETCEGAEPLLTLACDGSDTISGSFAAAEAEPGPGRIDARGSSVAIDLAPAEEHLAFEMPETFLDALARGLAAEIVTRGTTRTLHLTGSTAAIAAMRGSCAATAGDAANPDEVEPQTDMPDPTETSSDYLPPEGDALATGTAPHSDTIAAFATAWQRAAPDGPDTDAAPAARCDALAGGPVGDDGALPVPFARIEPEAARDACEAAMEAEPDAPRHAFHAARARLASGDEEEAAQELIRAASDAGYPPAMNARAVALLAGRAEIAPDEDTADLFTRAAEVGYAPALANLAVGGSSAGPLADHEIALDFAYDAATRGDPVAATLLGTMAFYGTGLPDDAALATRWMKIGAARGDPDALVALADIYSSGGGPAEAYRDSAIAAGHRVATLGAGLYAPGSVPPDRVLQMLSEPPIRSAWEDGLLYIGDGRDSDGALFWTLMWPRRSDADWSGGAVALEPLLDALAERYDCAGGRLYKITEARLGCADPGSPPR